MLFNHIFSYSMLAATCVLSLAIRGQDELSSQNAGLQKRTCYGGGEKWGSQIGDALDAVETACRTKFTGPYVAHENKKICYDIGNGKRVNFTLKRNANSGGDMDTANCRQYLRAEIVGCSHGGQRTRDNWTYRSDPNSGGC